MKRALPIFLFSLLLAFDVGAQSSDVQPNDIPDSGIPDSGISAPLPEQGAAKYSTGDSGPLAASFNKMRAMDNMVLATLMADRLEFRKYEGEEVFLWDLKSWIGGDYNKLFFESEGEHTFEKKTESAFVELLYGRTVSTFWDMRIGGRYDIRPNPERFYGSLGLLGLAPQWFEIEANLYLSEEAEVSADLEAEYDILLSQRLKLQPRFELEAAVEKNERYGTGAGVNQFELGLRLRYEISRKFAPYVGLSWERKIGQTANLAEREGEDESKLFWLAGLRLWF